MREPMSQTGAHPGIDLLGEERLGGVTSGAGSEFLCLEAAEQAFVFCAQTSFLT